MPSKRDNPLPRYASNTPEAAAHLPIYNAYGNRRWVRPAVYEEVEEITPLLGAPSSAASAVGSAAASDDWKSRADAGEPSWSSESPLRRASTSEVES